MRSYKESVTLFFEIHRELKREAPGDEASTLRALVLCTELPRVPRILDVGCGPGAQSLLLAQQTGGWLTALDNHPPFLDQLYKRAVAASLDGKIERCLGSMSDMTFPPQSFDLIWSEGAIYIMGSEKGLKDWRRLLKPRGYMAVSELTWLTNERPKAAVEFWGAGYPTMQDIDANLKAIESAGLKPVDHFTLPASAWWDYYGPIEKRIGALRRCHAGKPEAIGELGCLASRDQCVSRARRCLRPRVLCDAPR
jgi:SAM-dependent methyltransferase